MTFSDFFHHPIYRLFQNAGLLNCWRQSLSRLQINSWLKASTMVMCTVLVAGCQIESDPDSELDKIRERGVLRVGTLNNQLSYYIGPNGPTGLDYELAKRFADDIGVKLEMKPAYRLSGLFPALENNEIDIIAAGLSQNPSRMNNFRAAPVYYYVSQQVVYKTGSNRPRNMEKLIERETEHQEQLTVVADSIFVQTLNNQKESHPDLTFNIDKDSDVKELLQQVSEGKLAYTMANSVELSLTQRLYPNLAVAFELTEDQPISWYLRKSDNESLYALLIEFFGEFKQSGELATLEEKYFGHVESFDYVDTRAFIRALDSSLAEWEPLFRQYAQDFDWRLIAAVAYQESHWNPKAKSPTGVRGMMMLTLGTAKLVGVTNRLDPEQSIRGGVTYLQRIVDRIPDSIPEHEKIWFALASYNLGFGHIMDARRLTAAQNGNPDSWADVKERLPLLHKRKYYSQTRYGYARGNEAKSYVENIRRYYHSIIGHVERRSSLEEDATVDDLQIIDVPLPERDASAEDTAAENSVTDQLAAGDISSDDSSSDDKQIETITDKATQAEEKSAEQSESQTETTESESETDKEATLSPTAEESAQP